MLLALVITTNLLATTPPKVDVSSMDVMQVAECEKFVSAMNAMPAEPRVNAKGELILQRKYECLILTDLLIEQAAEMMKASK